MLYYQCGTYCMDSNCQVEFEFSDIFLWSDQQRIVFPHAQPGSELAVALSRPDAVRTETHVTPQGVSFEFWTHGRESQLYGHMTIQNGKLQFEQRVNGNPSNRLNGVCHLQPPLTPAQASRLHVPGPALRPGFA